LCILLNIDMYFLENNDKYIASIIMKVSNAMRLANMLYRNL
jgi:hypothetical protein